MTEDNSTYMIADDSDSSHGDGLTVGLDIPLPKPPSFATSSTKVSLFI